MSSAEGPAPAARPTSLESLLRRDRWLVGGALALAILLSWAWIVPMAIDMYGSMSGSSAWMMTAAPSSPLAGAAISKASVACQSATCSQDVTTLR